MFQLEGRRALVTGASGGIGEAITRVLYGGGAAVAVSGTRIERLQGLAGELGERAHVVPSDLGDPDAVAALPGAAEAALGGLDILVNCAGITRDNLAMRMKDEDWDVVVSVNLTAAFRLSRAVLRGMLRQRWGRIVNIASIVGVTGNPGQANYAAAKAGMIGMTKSLACEVANRGITANCVAPGFIETGDDGCARRRPARGPADPRALQAARHGGRDRRGRALPGKRRSRLHHRTDHPHQRRHGDDIERAHGTAPDGRGVAILTAARNPVNRRLRNLANSGQGVLASTTLAGGVVSGPFGPHDPSGPRNPGATSHIRWGGSVSDNRRKV